MFTVQVWLRPLAAAAAECLPAIHAGIAAVPAAGDILLGCAELDVAALQMLGSIEGWYNICDERQQMKGQLKVTVTEVVAVPQHPHDIQIVPQSKTLRLTMKDNCRTAQDGS